MFRLFCPSKARVTSGLLFISSESNKVITPAIHWGALKDVLKCTNLIYLYSENKHEGNPFIQFSVLLVLNNQEHTLKLLLNFENSCVSWPFIFKNTLQFLLCWLSLRLPCSEIRFCTFRQHKVQRLKKQKIAISLPAAANLRTWNSLTWLSKY